MDGLLRLGKYRVWWVILSVFCTQGVREVRGQAPEALVEYLSPLPNAERVSPTSPLIFRVSGMAAVGNATNVASVTGSVSGPVSGNFRTASDGRTILFKPTIPFALGEEVEVRLWDAVKGPEGRRDSVYTFHIDENETLPVARSTPPSDLNQERRQQSTLPLTQTADPVVINGISVPSDFPFMKVRLSDNPSPGYFFLNNWGGTPYNIIVDNAGRPVWYWRTPDRRRDFKLQPNGWLTMLIRHGYGGSTPGHIALDSTFTVVDTMRATAGYTTDEHELTMLANGHYFVIALRESRVDMSRFVAGGRTDAIVRETAIQEFTPEGDLVLFWRSWDNYDIRDIELEDLRGGYIRFPHLNAISIDADGHIVVSARHLSEVTKINRQTGEIIWRLGGAHNQFSWVDDPLDGFRSQHDIRALGDNRYTVFDNGNLRWPRESRAVEYELDEEERTARLVWQFRHDPIWYTPWMGNAQRLPNGNTLVNYADASLPKIVEVRSDGSTALEMDFEKSANAYRTFKFDWKGTAAKPYVIAQSGSAKVTLLMNKFGDSELIGYNVYGGTTPAPKQIIATADQPFIHLTELANRTTNYFRVTASYADGSESPPSDELPVYVNLIEPGSNMLTNGDFDRGLRFWDTRIADNAEAALNTTSDQHLHFGITDGGSDWSDVQVRQSGVPLIQGRRYRFEFDAYADEPRIFEARVVRDGEPWTNYGRIGLTSLTTEETHFMHDFTMEATSDFGTRVELNAGLHDADVYVDNVSIKELLPGTSSAPEQPESGQLIVYPNYPNPFSTSTTIPYNLPVAGHVVLRVFDMLGREVRKVSEGYRMAGPGHAVLDANGLADGTYMYHLELLSEPQSFNVSGNAVLLRSIGSPRHALNYEH